MAPTNPNSCNNARLRFFDDFDDVETRLNRVSTRFVVDRIFKGRAVLPTVELQLYSQERKSS